MVSQEIEPENLADRVSEPANQVGQIVGLSSQVEEKLRQARDCVRANNFSQAAANFRDALSVAENPQSIFDEVINIARDLEQDERYDELLTLTQYTGMLGLYGDIQDMRQRVYDARQKKQEIARKLRQDEVANLEIEKVRAAEQRKQEEERLRAETERQKDALRCLDEFRKTCTLGAAPENWALMVQKARLLQSYSEYPEPHREALLLFRQFFRAAGSQLQESHLQEFEALLHDFPENVSREVQAARTQAEAVRRTWQERQEAARQRMEWEHKLAQRELLLTRLKENDLAGALQTAWQMHEEGAADIGEIPGLLNSLKPYAERIVAQGMVDESEQVFAPWLKPAELRTFANMLRDVLASQLSGWFEPVREALQQGNNLLALKAIDALLIKHPHPPPGLDASWQGHWKGVLHPLIHSLVDDTRLDAARLKTLLLQVALLHKEQVDLAEAIDKAVLQRLKNATLIEQQQRSAVLQTLLSEGKFSQAVEYAEAWLVAAPEILPDRDNLLPVALTAAQKLADGDDLALLQRYLDVLGRLTGEEGFGALQVERFWEKRKAALQAKFTEISQALQVEPHEKVLPKMQALLSTEVALPPNLKPTWQQAWQQVIVQALTVNWVGKTALEKDLAFIMNRVYPTPEEWQSLAKAIEEALTEQQKTIEEIRAVFRKNYMTRLTDLDIQAGNSIYQKRQSKELTLGLYRLLLHQLKELLPESPSSDPVLQRVQSLTEEKLAILREAEELWTRAKRSKEPAEKQNIVDELLRRQFYGWKVPGDFEQELGLKKEVRWVAVETGKPEGRPTPESGRQETRQVVEASGPAGTPVPAAEAKPSLEFKQLKYLRELQWVYPLQCKREIQALLAGGMDEASQRDLENILKDYSNLDPLLLEKFEQAARDNLDDINYGIDLQKLSAGLKGLPRYADIVEFRRRLRQRNAPPPRLGGSR